MRVQLHSVDSTSSEPSHRRVHQGLADAAVPMARIDKHVVDMSIPTALEDFRSLEDGPQEETDCDPIDFGREAEAILAPDVLACESFPILLPSPSEPILRSAEIDVVLLELLPHSRERIEIRNSGDPDARVIGHETCHEPSPT